MERYKNFLLIEVEKDLVGFYVTKAGLLLGFIGETMPLKQQLPSGNYTIIGKGDEVGHYEFPLNSCKACNDLGVWHCAHPDECGQIKIGKMKDILKSKNLSPSTTLIIQDNG